MNSMKYRSISIKRKHEIIDRVENLQRKRKKDIAQEFKIPASTLSTILKNKDSLRKCHTFGGSKRMRCKDPTRTDVDAALYQWFTAARAQSIPISGEILKAKAEELSKEMGSLEWTCSSGWLSRCEKRHNITYRKICGESAGVDLNVCENWKESSLLPVLRRYDPSNIFNTDEMVDFYQTKPMQLLVIYVHEVRTARKE